MAVGVVKKDGESNEKLVSRFEKKVQQARVVQWLKKNRFFKSPEGGKRAKDRGIIAANFRIEREKLKFYQ